MALPQLVEGVNQHNIVVHDNPSQRDNPNAGHDRAEGLARQNEAQQHPNG